MAAVEAQDGREAGPIEAARVQQPGQEAAGFVVLADTEEGADADAGVAGPGEAVVPVAGPTGILGKRGCRRSNRRPGRRVGEEAQREQAAHDGVALREVEIDISAPRPPPRLVGLQLRPSSLWIN